MIGYGNSKRQMFTEADSGTLKAADLDLTISHFPGELGNFEKRTSNRKTQISIFQYLIEKGKKEEEGTEKKKNILYRKEFRA